ncbi:MAG TPA: DUF202 domain-containing protein [Candidatus Obscuribacterales bacterium]
MNRKVEDPSTDDERVRDHLANERTYLAWMRTGVATMGLGVVIAKLKYFLGNESADIKTLEQAANIGLLFAVIGIFTIVMSVFLFLQTRSEIRSASYRSRKGFVLVLSALTVALGLVILYYLMQP